MTVSRAIDHAARACALLVASCGALALGLLLSGHERVLALGLPGSPLMKPGSALGFVAAGLAVAGMGRRTRAGQGARASALALALLSALSLGLGLGRPGHPLAASATPSPLALAFLLVALAALRFDPAAGQGLRRAVVAGVTAGALSTGVLAFYAAWWWHAGERLLLVTLAPQSALLLALLALPVSALCLAATPPGFFRRHAWLLGVAGTMTAALVGAWGLVMATTSASMSREVAQRTQSVARTLLEHLHRSLDPADLILRQVALRIRDVGIERFAQSREDWSELAATAGSLQQIGAVVVLDREGRVVSFSGRFPAALPGNYAHRDYFLAHRRGETVHLGALIQTAMGPPAFTYSRRIDDRQGAFAGVVVATLELDYFRAFYRSLDLGHGGAVGLFRTDQRTLVREPAPEGLDVLDLNRDALFSRHVSVRDSGALVGFLPADPVERFIAYRVSKSLPVVVTASVSAAPLAADFAQEFFASAMLLTLAVMVLVNGTAQQLRAAARDAAHQRALEAGQATLQALIDGSLQGILVHKVHDEFKALFANEVAARMFGYDSAAQLLQEPDLRHLLPEAVQAELRQGWQRLCEGRIDALRSQVAALKRDGTPFSMEMLGRRIDWRGDAALQVAIMDVTERQRLEAELKRQASIDSLTSLLTRRHFNLLAEQELRRCRRAPQALTALMIDIDHFKRVNDTHGHQGGDAVLVRVAELIRGVLRGSDLVARFGGEEFVALLVGTDEDEAVAVAERLRQALHRECIVHKGREIRVSASFGISAWRPREHSLEPALGRADEALYAAKAAGRDRVRVHGAVAGAPQAVPAAVSPGP